MPSTKIKICGLSTPETVDAAVEAGATHVGFVHYEPSPRHVSLELARSLSERVPDPVKTVLLLVSMQAEDTGRALDAVQPDVVQFHGRETPEWAGFCRDNLPFEVWKAVGVKDAASLTKSLKYQGAVDRILYDAPAQALPGGNGMAVDWSLLAGHEPGLPWGLAGGLTPENVADAIRQTGAPLVDTSSGVENAPGVKDVDKIRTFCEAARNA